MRSSNRSWTTVLNNEKQSLLILLGTSDSRTFLKSSFIDVTMTCKVIQIWVKEVGLIWTFWWDILIEERQIIIPRSGERVL